MSSGARTRPAIPWWASVLVVCAACAAVYWPWIGHAGLSSSEGHRVIPGWTMLETGDWLTPHLFERPYLRKPPGMPWAVAGMSALFGPTEWSARAVSALAATLSALAAFAYARRWLGPPWGLVAGLAHVLTPWFWGSARSAEIESLHQLGASLAAFAAVDLMVGRRTLSLARAVSSSVLVAGLIIMLFSKGPVGLPIVGAAMAGVCIARRSLRPLARPDLGLAIILATGLVATLAWLVAHAASRLEAMPVTQGVGEFLWFGRDDPTLARVLRVLALGPGALLAAIPASLGIPLVLAQKRAGLEPGELAARALALGALLALLFYTAIGVWNTRYAMPAAAVIAPVFAAAMRLALSTSDAPELARRRGAIRWSASALGIAILALGVYFASWTASRRDHKSGRNAGYLLAEQLPPDAEVWADHLVEARPEVLWYAQERSEALGRRLDARWVAHERAARQAQPGILLALRTDPESPELQSFDLDRLQPLTKGAVHKYTFVIYRVLLPPRRPEKPG